MREGHTLLYSTLAFGTLMFLLAAAYGWNSVLLGWGRARKSLRRYLVTKLARLGLLFCLALGLVAASVPLANAVSDDWAIGATLVTMIVPPLAVVCAALVWWIGELSGALASRRFKADNLVTTDKLKAL
jgi:hypothetical protein